MKKPIAVVACATLAVLPGSALGKTRTKVYRATFAAVGADGAYTSGRFGKAQLVDGRRNDKLSVHVRHLAGRTRYVFRLRQAPVACAQRAPGGTDVSGWRYRRGGVLHTSRKGNANSWARSHSFSAKKDVEYSVGVYTATTTGAPGELVLCAELRTKGHKKGHGGKHKPEKRGGTDQHPSKPRPPHPHAFRAR